MSSNGPSADRREQGEDRAGTPRQAAGDSSREARVDPPGAISDTVMSLSPRDVGGQPAPRGVGPGIAIDDLNTADDMDALLDRAANDVREAALQGGIPIEDAADNERSAASPCDVAPGPAGHGVPDPSLVEFVERAESASRELREVLDQAARRDVGTTRAAVHLQERLRLGARMLKAFNDQVSAAETSMNTLHEITRAAESSTTALRAAMPRLDGAAGLESRLATMIDRAQVLINATESAEVNIVTLLHRVGRAATRAEELAARGDAVEGGRTLRDDLLTLLCMAMQQVDDLEKRTARLESLESRLDQLTERLAPWAKLVEREDGSPHPEIVIDIKDERPARAPTSSM